MVATRILTDRFGDTWTVCAGKEAAAIRRQILAEQDALPKVTMTREEIEREVGRRVAAEASTGLSSLRDQAAPRLDPPGFNPLAQEKDAA